MTRSKWLDWKLETGSVGFEGSDPVGNSIIEAIEGGVTPVPALPADTIIEETAQGEPTKPTNLGFVGFEGVASTPSSTSERRSDPYACGVPTDQPARLSRRNDPLARYGAPKTLRGTDRADSRRNRPTLEPARATGRFRGRAGPTGSRSPRSLPALPRGPGEEESRRYWAP